MNRFKRILSALVIAAMALSLMPTFASATVGDSIVYDFNESTDASYSATSVTSYTDAEKGWMYYDMTAGKAAAYLPSYNPNYIQITSSVGQYFAIKIKVPESGKYDMSLVCYQHATIGGSADMYLLPGTTKQENIAALIETAETVNGNDVLFYADKNTYPTTLNVAFDYQILAGEYVLVFKATGISPYMTNAAHISKQYAYMYPATLTLTKTAEAEDDGEVIPPAEEEKKDPITLTFNNGTVSGDNQTYMNALASSSDDFSIVAAETMGEAQGAQYSRANAINLMFRAKAGTSQQNYFKMIGNETDANAGKFTVQANNIPAGTYKVDLNVTDNARGIGAYVYVGNKYVGFCDTYKSDREWGANPADTDTKEIGYVTIVDEDNNAETTNTVKIAICSAAIDASSTTSNYLTLKSITFTPVDAIPAYGDLTYEVTGATAAGDGYTVENNTTLSLTAMLSAKHLNGYNLDGTKDSENYIKITSSNPEVISVTDTEAALDSAKIYASGYKPVYTLTALKSNASADITVEAIVDGNSVASESFKVTVAKSDADEYEAEAVFAWGTTLPSELSGNVTVSEKDGGTVNAGEITASKGAVYTFKATEGITVGEITYKFIGWKRGTTSNGAAAFISYEPEDEYTVWSNTYITAVYEEVHSDEKRVEFYDQDGYFLGYMSETDFKANGLPDTNPKLLGHTFSKWQYVENGETKDFTAETELTESVTRVVALQTPAEVTITYKNENDEVAVTKTYGYDEEVDALYDSGIDGVKFWKLLVGNSEKTVRTNEGYSFYAWANTTLKGYTGEVTEKLPKAVLHNTPHDDSYMIEYDRYSKSYTIVETGILLGDSESISLLSCEKKYTSAKGGRAHGQFAAPHENYDYVRGYIIYKTNETGAISVVYTDAIATGK